MAEYAPEAIRWLAQQIQAKIPKSKLSGIVGDSSHTYGYHRARSTLPKSDYSVQLAEDRAGDADAASALDISFTASDMKTVTGRLLKSAKDEDDPRLNYCREFYGTLDGKKVAGWDTHFGNPATSDDSHLWHVHISFLRKYATDKTAMAAVLSVIVGENDPGDDDVSAKDVWTYDPNELGQGGVANVPGRDDFPDNKTVQPGYALSDAWNNTRQILAEQAAAKDRETKILAAIGELKTTLGDLSATLAKQLGPKLVTAVRSGIGDDLDDAQLTQAIEAAVRSVLGGLDGK